MVSTKLENIAECIKEDIYEYLELDIEKNYSLDVEVINTTEVSIKIFDYKIITIKKSQEKYRTSIKPPRLYFFADNKCKYYPDRLEAFKYLTRKNILEMIKTIIIFQMILSN